MIIESVILAAGFSSRCNRDKMLLPIKNKTVIEQCIQAFDSSCSKIIVVSGFYHNDIYNVLKKYKKVEIVYNPNYQNGMFSSVRTGVAKVQGDRFFITPGDYPFIKSETIEQMLNVDSDLVKPVYKGLQGHPILLKNNLIPRIMAWQHTSLRDCLSEVNRIQKEVSDKGIIMDIDTMEDYFNSINDSTYPSISFLD